MTTAVDVAVIDYGMGNLHSVAKALQRVAPKANVWVGDDPALIRRATRVVYPGVGAIRDCMGEVRRRGLDEVIVEVARSKPLLGICVGMQGLMHHSSENNGIDCLDVFPDEVVFFGDAFAKDACLSSAQQRLKVPHMGWNALDLVDRSDPLWHGLPENPHVYFVHSYYPQPEDDAVVSAHCDYGLRFAAAARKGNIVGTQFHPEKSQALGLGILRNFTL